MHFGISGMRIDCDTQKFYTSQPALARKHNTLYECFGAMEKTRFYMESAGKARFFFVRVKIGGGWFGGGLRGFPGSQSKLLINWALIGDSNSKTERTADGVSRGVEPPSGIRPAAFPRIVEE
jgi:hypothetical protein